MNSCLKKFQNLKIYHIKKKKKKKKKIERKKKKKRKKEINFPITTILIQKHCYYRVGIISKHSMHLSGPFFLYFIIHIHINILHVSIAFKIFIIFDQVFKIEIVSFFHSEKEVSDLLFYSDLSHQA